MIKKENRNKRKQVLRKKKKLKAVISPNRDKCSSLLEKSAQDKMFYLQDIGEKIFYTGEDEENSINSLEDEPDEIEKAPLGDETQSSALS